MEHTSPRVVGLVAYDGVQSLDVTGPLEVFSGAARLLAAAGSHERSYVVRLISPHGGVVLTSSGLKLTPDWSLSEAPATIDTLVICGGEGAIKAAEDKELVDWVKARSRSARRTVSVCTGAFILAAAGLLEGRRATTHWAASRSLRAGTPRFTSIPFRSS